MSLKELMKLKNEMKKMHEGESSIFTCKKAEVIDVLESRIRRSAGRIG